MRYLLVAAIVAGFGSVALADEPIDTHKNEDIHIDQKIVRPQMPKMLSDRQLIPPYSDDAKMGNVWVVAWVWADIDETGKVQRIKFIKRPGHDLDRIAIDWAMSREFTPALNQFGHPTRSLVHFEMEWPSYYWLMDLKYSARRLPTGADMSGFSVEGDGAPGSKANTPAEGSLSLLPPCAHQAGWVLDSVRPHVWRDCTKPDLSHANAAEPWYPAKNR